MTRSRVFQECLTYGGEMDYKTYLDFVLALENKREPQALSYFFRILDVKQVWSLLLTLHLFRCSAGLEPRLKLHKLFFQMP